LWDIHNVGETFTTLGNKMESFASEIKGQASGYQWLYDSLNTQLERVDDSIKSRRFLILIEWPSEWMSPAGEVQP
jgi:hypothetical protein